MEHAYTRLITDDTCASMLLGAVFSLLMKKNTGECTTQTIGHCKAFTSMTPVFTMVSSCMACMESDLGQYSFSCLRVGFMSSCRVDHVFVSCSCLRVGLIMSSCRVDHVFVSG